MFLQTISSLKEVNMQSSRQGITMKTCKHTRTLKTSRHTRDKQKQDSKQYYVQGMMTQELMIPKQMKDQLLGSSVPCPCFYTLPVPSVPRLFTKMNFTYLLFHVTFLTNFKNFHFFVVPQKGLKKGLKRLHKIFLRYHKQV